LSWWKLPCIGWDENIAKGEEVECALRGHVLQERIGQSGNGTSSRSDIKRWRHSLSIGYCNPKLSMKTRPKPFSAYFSTSTADSQSHRLRLHNASQTTTSATTLATCGVGWCGCYILDPADLHPRTSEGAEGRLSSWTRGFGTITYIIRSAKFYDLRRGFIPPVALILICSALMPNSLHLAATS